MNHPMQYSLHMKPSSCINYFSVLLLIPLLHRFPLSCLERRKAWEKKCTPYHVVLPSLACPEPLPNEITAGRRNDGKIMAVRCGRHEVKKWRRSKENLEKIYGRRQIYIIYC